MGCCTTGNVLVVEHHNNKIEEVNTNNNKIIEIEKKNENKIDININENDNQFNTIESFFEKIEYELNRIIDLLEQYNSGNNESIITPKNYKFYMKLKFIYGKIKQILENFMNKEPINENNKIDFTNKTIDLIEGSNILNQLKICENQQYKQILNEIDNSLELRLLKDNN
jgi:Zn-dependent oligopeptidase